MNSPTILMSTSMIYKNNPSKIHTNNIKAIRNSKNNMPKNWTDLLKLIYLNAKIQDSIL